MRFISRISAFKIEVLGQKRQQVGDEIIITEPSTIAEFRQEAIHPWEEKAARESFQFLGVTEEDPHSGIPVDPIGRVSVFDTQEAQKRFGWSDEKRDLVEKNLITAQLSNSQDFILVNKPPLEKPWPSYETTHHAKIASMVEELGLDKAEVIEYEKENKNRPSVIEALEGIEDPTVVSA